MPSRGIRDLKDPGPAKLICGLLFNDSLKGKEAVSALEKTFGTVDFSSPLFPFDMTEYYNKETGNNIKRLFISFKNLVPQDTLAEIKIKCREIEFTFSKKRQRSVNIDPGILTAERIVLATSKNFTHRIYIGSGVHADLSLIYQGKSFRELPWTFADYKKKEVIEFWNQVRSVFMKERRSDFEKSE